MIRPCPVWPKIDSQRGASLDLSLRAHLARCGACAAEWEAVEWLARAARDLRCDRPDPERTEQVRTLLLAAARQGPPLRRTIHRLRAWPFVAAAVLLLALGSAFAYRSSSGTDSRAAAGQTPHDELAPGRAHAVQAAEALPSATTPVPQASCAPADHPVAAATAAARAGAWPEARSQAAARAVKPLPSAPGAADPVEVAFAEGFRALDRGELRLAERAFQRAAGEGHSRLSEDAAFWRAVTLARAGSHEPAAAAFSEFLAHYPGSPRRGEASVLLGRLLMHAGDAREAEQHFSEAAADRRPDIAAAARQGREEAAQTPPQPREMR